MEQKCKKKFKQLKSKKIIMYLYNVYVQKLGKNILRSYTRDSIWTS